MGTGRAGSPALTGCLTRPHHALPDYVSGGEMFTHLYQREHFSEAEVRVYGGEIVLALEHLHKVGELRGSET